MKRFGKKDFLLILALLFVILIIWLAMTYRRVGGSYVTVTVDGEIYGEYALDTAQEIPIVIDEVTTNVLLIRNGVADMTEASCPDKLCVHQPAISKSKENIVCLPNRVVVTAESVEMPEVDSIAK